MDTAPTSHPPYASADERTWSTAAHWSALVGAALGLTVAGPLLVLLLKGSSSPRVRAHALESLNFQISVLIYSLVAIVPVVILSLVTFGLALLAILPLILVAVVLWLVATILGTAKANDGDFYRYPMTLRLVT